MLHTKECGVYLSLLVKQQARLSVGCRKVADTQSFNTCVTAVMTGQLLCCLKVSMLAVPLHFNPGRFAMPCANSSPQNQWLYCVSTMVSTLKKVLLTAISEAVDA